MPLIFRTEDWKLNDKNSESANADFLTSLLEDPLKARLYWALASMDSETRDSLRRAPGLPRLVTSTALLDFYGADVMLLIGGALLEAGDRLVEATAAFVEQVRSHRI